MRKITRNGVAPARNGIRRPHRLRNRSLRKLMNGLITMFIRFGIVVRINPSTQFGAPMALNFSGITLGTTVSMSVKQKSPHSKNRNIETSPAFV